MALRIGDNNTAATVARVKLRVGVASVEPGVQTTVVVAAAEIAYVDLTLSVLVDTNGRYKLVNDAVALPDAARIRTEKPFAHAVVAAETAELSFSHPSTDVLGATDVFSRVVGFSRLFADAVAETDAQVFSVEKPLSDTFTTPHFEVFDHQKLLVDGVAMNDGMEAVDGFGIALTRGVSNVAQVGDAKTLSFMRSRVESISPQDAGSLRSQGYCDFSYFAEDYVGAALAF